MLLLEHEDACVRGIGGRPVPTQVPHVSARCSGSVSPCAELVLELVEVPSKSVALQYVESPRIQVEQLDWSWNGMSFSE